MHLKVLKAGLGQWVHWVGVFGFVFAERPPWGHLRSSRRVVYGFEGGFILYVGDSR